MEFDSASAAPKIATPVSPRSRSSKKLSLAGIRPWTWFVIDYALAYVCATMALAFTPHSLDPQSAATHVGAFGFSIGAALAVAVVAHIAGLHELNQRRRSFSLLGRCFLVSLSALAIINAELLLVHYLTVGRFVSVFTLLGCTVGLFVLRLFIVGIAVRNSYVTAIVGSRDFIDRAWSFVDADDTREVKLITLDLEKNANTNIREWALTNGVDQIVVDTDDPLVPSESELLKLIDGNLTVSTYTSFVENLFERVPSQHINAQWIIESQAEHASLYKSTFKRFLDIVVSVFALILLSPLLLLAAIAVKLESRGPVVYRQVRVGQYGQPFTMLKLRSMRADAEKDGAKWASETDDRVTRVGNFLRNSRLDEVPQLLNVLAGDMSLVGPRPERPEFTESLEKRIPFFVHRLLVKPGITGWAQINADYAASEAASVKKLSFDLYYVKMLSFAMDVRVLLRTISRFARGAR